MSIGQQTSGSNPEPDLHMLFDAIDDLWGCIGPNEIAHLHPDTVATANLIHQLLWHQ